MVNAAEAWAWVGIVLAVAMLRYVSRTLQLGGLRNLQLEDLAMAVTVIFYILLTVFLIQVDKHGTNGVPASESDTLDPATFPDRIVGSKMVVAVEQFWLVAVWGCKLCLLLLYSTMTYGLWQHRFVKIIGAICISSFILIEILFFAVWCRPFSAYWSVPAKSQQCSVYTNHVIITLAFNVSTDIMIMAIPLPLLIRAKLSLSKKIILCAVFSLGTFVILCSILSKCYSISKPYGMEWIDWYVREAATAVIVANIPQTWTLCRRLFNWNSFLYHSSYNTHGTRNRRYETGSRLYGSTTRLSRFRRGESASKSQLRSTVDDTANEQRLEIWALRQFDVTNEAVVDERSESGSLSRGSNTSLDFDAVTPSGPIKTTVTVKQAE
ncbi:hypothetical protein ASPVEDRAFT_78497 [Aspergillus versicolor CBS 583.65]|uniref:Rhodopsin domain-containing protein n=1 Tax=Aspergillus versicolor CBS 583.65 TaxID=1036611 RepID=A0A1L9P5D8_ASPVE|nr:uncharacterized protein ASPVEDRAFT_78497 [Aspergillus versicolor CBS 583.65]OJI96745.1 hypothetical protein ASPVEDRAFT_78497 [Aspergillus versicolor CBS 583.65]